MFTKVCLLNSFAFTFLFDEASIPSDDEAAFLWAASPQPNSVIPADDRG